MRRTLLCFIIIILFFNVNCAYGEASITETIRIGLNYEKTAFSNINIKSENPIKILLDKGEEINLELAVDIGFRKDDYYNIVNGESNRIQYIKAVKYSGELLGPYHIQIGTAYKDYSTAKQSLNALKKSHNEAYIAFEDGWRIWHGLFFDRKECQEYIESLQKKQVDLQYTIIEPNERRIQVIDYTSDNIFMIYNSNEAILRPNNSSNDLSLMQFNGLNYRGSIIIRVLDDGSIGVINQLPLEWYLYGVVPSEIYTSWHIEALKAQAVAARNYAINNINKHKKDGYDLCSTQHCQAYKGYDNEHKNTNIAVEQTQGKLLYYKDQLAQTYYHSSSGGHTENSENVWSQAVPYIKGVDDSLGLGSPNDNWVSELERTFIENKLMENNFDIGKLKNLNILEASEFGRVTKLEVVGTKKSIILEKEKIRLIFGTNNLKSTWYEIGTESDISIFDLINNKTINKRSEGLSIISANGEKRLSAKQECIYIQSPYETKKYSVRPNKYIFYGKGWGHGLGMSQYGAKGMAESGYNYKEILEYYYKGTKVK